MKCPFCKSLESQVLESRVSGEGLRRRRECLNCDKRFTTVERIVRSTLWVVKKDKKREPYERDKIVKGILRAIRKRPVSLNQVEEIADTIESEILRSGVTEVQSSVIGKSVLSKLKKTDKVAWLRFASVYLEFENLTDFENAIDTSQKLGERIQKSKKVN